MCPSNQGRFRQQFDFLRRQFLQDGQLQLTNVLSSETITQALQIIADGWKDRIFTPLVTLWVFLGQVLSADHSCRFAVARLIAHRVSQGSRPVPPAREPTSRRENDCQNSCFRQWLVWSVVLWIPKLMSDGCLNGLHSSRSRCSFSCSR